MSVHVIIAAGVGLGIFIMFLVIARTVNSLINQVSKLEYLLEREMEYRKESLEIRRLLELERQREERRHGAQAETEGAAKAETEGAAKAEDAEKGQPPAPEGKKK